MHIFVVLWGDAWFAQPQWGGTATSLNAWQGHSLAMARSGWEYTAIGDFLLIRAGRCQSQYNNSNGFDCSGLGGDAQGSDYDGATDFWT